MLKLRGNKIEKKSKNFLISSLIITIFLAFIIEIRPHHLLRSEFNISNLITYLFYFIVVGTYFLFYMKLLSHNKYLLIIISYILFGLANTVDLLSDGKIIDFDYDEIIEELLHILGIIFWLIFFIDFSKMLKRNTDY
ncbi:MAG: hypothetical protein D8M26_05205 [Ignavibacteriae bacterium]|nr:MAG: hypothetical protein EDM72_03530 [Chlorobiota bacterium]MBL1122266.1 hypothetical protein [Ignavibacteriota bacterium]MCE7855421.1 hypothetical protein [Ignavibacteria bacterium CHB3]NUM62150.1 hypothetical protein [Ignavibacteriaceae bacterium]